MQHNTGALVNPQAARCVDIAGANYSNGTPIASISYHGHPAHMWQPQPNGTLKNIAAGRCLQIVNGGSANGAAPSCGTVPAQPTRSGHSSPTAAGRTRRPAGAWTPATTPPPASNW